MSSSANPVSRLVARVRLAGGQADRQGELPDQLRVARALKRFVSDVSFETATYLESCIHCGLCAEVCEFYDQTGDPCYTPVLKLEPFKQAYKREASPFWFLYKAFNLKPAVTLDQLEAWQHLLYDSCTLCGRCSMVCPMGIDIAALIGIARHGMADAGLVPDALWQVARRQQQSGSPDGGAPAQFRERIQAIGAEHGVAMPVDLEQAEIMLTVSSLELEQYPKTVADRARILDHMGYTWTYRSEAYEPSNYGLLTGDEDLQRALSQRLIDAAASCRAQVVVLPECGHAYEALRWQAANGEGQALPFRVLHISELLAEGVASGRLRVRPAGGSVTFHDPCQVSRRGGATAAPRAVLKALGVELHELPSGGNLNWCCGGGGGVLDIARAEGLRHGNFKVKMRQVEQSGADQLFTSCSGCRKTFDDGGEHFDWDRQVGSLVELVADHLAD